MPFPTRVIPSRTDIDECIHNNAVANILEKVAVSNMIGILTQMNLLSKHASEVFGDVLKDANRSLERITECKKRLNEIEQNVPVIERRFLEKAPSYFYDNPYTGKEWQRNDSLRGLLFRRERASMEVNRRRGNAEKPPDISSMDHLNEDKKPCLKKYTDADFFMNEWLEAERLRTEEQKQKRKEKKEKRKRKREERQVVTEIRAVVKKEYNPLGKEFSSESTPTKETFVKVEKKYNFEESAQRSEFEVSTGGRLTTPGGGGENVPKKSNVENEKVKVKDKDKENQKIQNMNVLVTPPDQDQSQTDELDRLDSYGEESHEKTATVIIHQPQPSYIVAEDDAPQTLSLGSAVQEHIVRPPAFNAYNNVPQQPPEREVLTPEMMAFRSMQQADERMRKDDEDRKRREIEKKKLANVMPIKGTNLLLAIRDGTTRANLRKAEQVKREPNEDGRSKLLKDITSKQNLKHVDTSKIAPKEDTTKKEGGIYEILKRREIMGESEDSDSGSEWGSESN